MSLIAAATVSDDWDARGGEEETTVGKLVSWVAAMGGGELGNSDRAEGGGGRLLSGAGEGGGRREPTTGRQYQFQVQLQTSLK